MTVSRSGAASIKMSPMLSTILGMFNRGPRAFFHLAEVSRVEWNRLSSVEKKLLVLSASGLQSRRALWERSPCDLPSESIVFQQLTQVVEIKDFDVLAIREEGLVQS